jgi:hypothetical protein
MWAAVLRLNPYVLLAGLLLLAGVIVWLGVWLVQRGFDKEWEAPADPGSMPARFASGEFPVLTHRTLSQDWRTQLGAEQPGAQGGRHRIERHEHTQPIILPEDFPRGWGR